MGAFFNLPPEVIGQTPLALIGTPEQCVAELRRRIDAWELSQITFSFTDEGTMKRLAAMHTCPALRAFRTADTSAAATGSTSSHTITGA